MSAELSITLDARNLLRFRTLLAEGGRKAAAQSLTFTAEKAKPAWWALNHRHFHMRGPGVDRSIHIKMATQSNLTAKIGSVDAYMQRHVIGAGEDKRPDKSNLFVPIKPVEQQGTHTQIRSQLRKMMQTKTKPFWRHGELLRRTSRAHDAPLTVIAVVRKLIHIKTRLDVEPAVEGVFRREFPSVYERLLLKALDA